MNLLYSHSPWETETGSAGEQPVKGYRGQAHQTMRGRDVRWASRPPKTPHRMIDLPCLKKRNITHCKRVSKKPGAPQSFLLPGNSRYTMCGMLVENITGRHLKVK